MQLADSEHMEHSEHIHMFLIAVSRVLYALHSYSVALYLTGSFTSFFFFKSFTKMPGGFIA